jgi:hypothetical protein
MWSIERLGGGGPAVVSLGDLTAAVANSLGATRQWTPEGYVEAHGLGWVLDRTRTLLRDAFGETSRVAPRLTTDRETGEPSIVFDLEVDHVTTDDMDRFLDSWLAAIPAALALPILTWRPRNAD